MKDNVEAGSSLLGMSRCVSQLLMHQTIRSAVHGGIHGSRGPGPHG
jgi:hypothetical protein